MDLRRKFSARSLIALLLLLAACTPQDEGGDAATETGDGLVTGLAREKIVVHARGVEGDGLIIQLPDGSPLSIDEDGTIQTDVPAGTADKEVSVLHTPLRPHQECDVSRVGLNTVIVYCLAQRWAIGGTVVGLEGRGLVIGVNNVVPEDLPIGQSGGFDFERSLEDDTDYEVVVRTQPTAPRQTCTVENGVGFADGFDISDVTVTCETERYEVKTTVVGLAGGNLTFVVGDGAPTTVNASGQYVSGTMFADGSQVPAKILTQPSTPSQLCHLQAKSAVIDGTGAEISIVCGAGGNLRISEVGACPFTSSSCWFEVYNISDWSEQLAYYSLRSGAITPEGKRIPSQTFDLEFGNVPGRDVVVIQAATKDAIESGSNVTHVSYFDTVPFWTADGYLELLDEDGGTVDFVRFGKSTEEPTTGGTWGGDAAPALPVGIDAFGQSIAHIRRIVPFSAGADWVSRVFATYAGPNDVDLDEDADQDGLPDASELAGATFSGVDVYSMGARVGQKDIFIEIDFMNSTDPGLTPRREALDSVVAAFARHGFSVHFDVGSLYAREFSPSAYNLGGGTGVPFAPAIGLGAAQAGYADLYHYKAVYMEGERRTFFHYMLFGNSQRLDQARGSSGIGEVRGNDSIITLGGLLLNASSPEETSRLINYQAATMMHELGHNLGLRHGGMDEVNFKPNYPSVMNYMYSPYGLPTIGTNEGDRYYLYAGCGTVPLISLTSSPLGPINRFRLDFSDGAGAEIDEAYIDERRGLGRIGSGVVDFDCNGRTNVGYKRDLNSDNKFDVLTDNNDWLKIKLPFTRLAAGAPGSTPLETLGDDPHDYLSGDRSSYVSD